MDKTKLHHPTLFTTSGDMKIRFYTEPEPQPTSFEYSDLSSGAESFIKDHIAWKCTEQTLTVHYASIGEFENALSKLFLNGPEYLSYKEFIDKGIDISSLADRLEVVDMCNNESCSENGMCEHCQKPVKQIRLIPEKEEEMDDAIEELITLVESLVDFPYEEKENKIKQQFKITRI